MNQTGDVVRPIYNIGIFCDEKISDDKIVSAMLSEGQNNPISYDSSDELVSNYNVGRVSGLVFGLEYFDAERLELVQSLLSNENSTPIAIVSRRISKIDHGQIQGIENVFVLKYPKELEDLPGVFRKMILSEKLIAMRKKKS